ncbi:hypothetical protein GQ42DRAFT_153284 [Ramicandelaber brevisporus]|nr:hypothetical protein GQ42DRAFT_153284 [Ramicandelaber brevisporus]
MRFLAFALFAFLAAITLFSHLILASPDPDPKGRRNPTPAPRPRAPAAPRRAPTPPPPPKRAAPVRAQPPAPTRGRPAAPRRNPVPPPKRAAPVRSPVVPKQQPRKPTAGSPVRHGPSNTRGRAPAPRARTTQPTPRRVQPLVPARGRSTAPAQSRRRHPTAPAPRSPPKRPVQQQRGRPSPRRTQSPAPRTRSRVPSPPKRSRAQSAPAITKPRARSSRPIDQRSRPRSRSSSPGARPSPAGSSRGRSGRQAPAGRGSRQSAPASRSRSKSAQQSATRNRRTSPAGSGRGRAQAISQGSRQRGITPPAHIQRSKTTKSGFGSILHKIGSAAGRVTSLVSNSRDHNGRSSPKFGSSKPGFLSHMADSVTGTLSRLASSGRNSRSKSGSPKPGILNRIADSVTGKLSRLASSDRSSRFKLSPTNPFAPRTRSIGGDSGTRSAGGSRSVSRGGHANRGGHGGSSTASNDGNHSANRNGRSGGGHGGGHGGDSGRRGGKASRGGRGGGRGGGRAGNQPPPTREQAVAEAKKLHKEYLRVGELARQEGMTVEKFNAESKVAKANPDKKKKNKILLDARHSLSSINRIKGVRPEIAKMYQKLLKAGRYTNKKFKGKGFTQTHGPKVPKHNNLPPGSTTEFNVHPGTRDTNKLFREERQASKKIRDLNLEVKRLESQSKAIYNTQCKSLKAAVFYEAPGLMEFIISKQFSDDGAAPFSHNITHLLTVNAMKDHNTGLPDLGSWFPNIRSIQLTVPNSCESEYLIDWPQVESFVHRGRMAPVLTCWDFDWIKIRETQSELGLTIPSYMLKTIHLIWQSDLDCNYIVNLLALPCLHTLSITQCLYERKDKDPNPVILEAVDTLKQQGTMRPQTSLRLLRLLFWHNPINTSTVRAIFAQFPRLGSIQLPASYTPLETVNQLDKEFGHRVSYENMDFGELDPKHGVLALHFSTFSGGDSGKLLWFCMDDDPKIDKSNYDSDYDDPYYGAPLDGHSGSDADDDEDDEDDDEGDNGDEYSDLDGDEDDYSDYTDDEDIN